MGAFQMSKKLGLSANKVLSATAFLTVACLIYLTYLNHNHFANTVISDVKKELLMAARSEVQSLEKVPGDLREKRSELLKLVHHIENEENLYTLILDDAGTIVLTPDAKQVGKNIHLLLRDRMTGPDLSQAEKIVTDMSAGKEGAATVKFFSENTPPEIVNTIAVFSPIRKDGKIWSIAILKELHDVEGPIHKDLRNNFILLGFVLFILSLAGLALFQNQKKNFKLQVSMRALEIINRQLHLDIADYKMIEKKLYGSLKVKKNPDHPSPQSKQD